jgi:hypothetical protein
MPSRNARKSDGGSVLVILVMPVIRFLNNLANHLQKGASYLITPSVALMASII